MPAPPPPSPFADRCPRCRGWLALRRDPVGAYLACVTCGYVQMIGGVPSAAPGLHQTAL